MFIFVPPVFLRELLFEPAQFFRFDKRDFFKFLYILSNQSAKTG